MLTWLKHFTVATQALHIRRLFLSQSAIVEQVAPWGPGPAVHVQAASLHFLLTLLLCMLEHYCYNTTVAVLVVAGAPLGPGPAVPVQKGPLHLSPAPLQRLLGLHSPPLRPIAHAQQPVAPRHAPLQASARCSPPPLLDASCGTDHMDARCLVVHLHYQALSASLSEVLPSQTSLEGSTDTSADLPRGVWTVDLPAQVIYGQSCVFWHKCRHGTDTARHHPYPQVGGGASGGKVPGRCLVVPLRCS